MFRIESHYHRGWILSVSQKIMEYQSLLRIEKVHLINKDYIVSVLLTCGFPEEC
ncbi:hypothetical protein BOSE127_140243 [Bosea sp. 127]|nr:hypothetical protein BOSE7B_90303 [Bosea sp. 7B]VXB64490.1 hypothetical protein BOSE127_140243 [Bosea sp. 127]